MDWASILNSAKDNIRRTRGREDYLIQLCMAVFYGIILVVKGVPEHE